MPGEGAQSRGFERSPDNLHPTARPVNHQPSNPLIQVADQWSSLPSSRYPKVENLYLVVDFHKIFVLRHAVLIVGQWPKVNQTRQYGRTPGTDRLEINQGVIRPMWDEIAQWLVFAKHLLWLSIKDITTGKTWSNKHQTCVQLQGGQKCIHPTSTILEIVGQRIWNNFQYTEIWDLRVTNL